MIHLFVFIAITGGY